MRLETYEEIAKRNYKVVYVPHEKIKDFNACYNVIWEGKHVRPPAAEKLRIPLNEIWISEKWRKYEEYVLYHELQEIKYRAIGYDKDEAHVLAAMDCISRWRNDAKWREMIVEIHISDIENMYQEIISSKNANCPV